MNCTPLEPYPRTDVVLAPDGVIVRTVRGGVDDEIERDDRWVLVEHVVDPAKTCTSAYSSFDTV